MPICINQVYCKIKLNQQNQQRQLSFNSHMHMKKVFTQLILCAMPVLAMAQSQYFYEWKDGVIAVRNISDIDSISFPRPNDVANFVTGSPSSLTGNSMIASYSVSISGVFASNVADNEMGVCYSSTTAEPSVADDMVKYGAYAEGTWEVALTDLSGSTLYYYRPYLKVGSMVCYGPVKTFTTLKSTTKSLWDLLEGRKDLSKFCDLVGKTPYYWTDGCPAYSFIDGKEVFYTFRDVLKANTHMTIWAPVNDAFSDEEWAKFNAMAESNGYLLQQQLIGNHMSLLSKAMASSGQEKVALINGRTATFDYSDATFQGAKIVDEDIPAYNGVMHVIKKGNAYEQTIYEYIKYEAGAKTLRDYIVQRDTLTLREGAQLECLLDEKGYPIFTSPIVHDNMMFRHSAYNPTELDADDAWMNDMKMFNADIAATDSAYVMIVPTDQAWQNATEQMKPYYKYVSTYPRMDKTKISSTKASTSSVFSARNSYENGKGYETVDSLQDVNINMDIVAPLVFNVNAQPHNGQNWTVEAFVNGGYKECAYLLATSGDTIRDVYAEVGGVQTLVWSKNSLFEGASVKEMRNGCAIVTDKWNYPRSYWMRDIDVEASVFKTYDKSVATNTTEFDINNTISKDWIDEYGRCSEQKYLQVSGRSASTNPEIAFALEGSKQGNADVVSGKYDVQIVLVPRWYETSGETPDVSGDTYKNKLVCTLYYWDESLIGGSDLNYHKQNKIVSDKIEYSGEKVDTITIMTDVEFPVSYKNLNNVYPVLHIKSDLTNADIRRGYYSRAFNIDRIILKSKD